MKKKFGFFPTLRFLFFSIWSFSYFLILDKNFPQIFFGRKTFLKIKYQNIKNKERRLMLSNEEYASTESALFRMADQIRSTPNPLDPTIEHGAT